MMYERLYRSKAISQCLKPTRQLCVNISRRVTCRYFCNAHPSSEAATFEKRIFSGIQPTGIPHIGNYFGAIKQWVELQEAQNLVILSIVDLHAITVPQDPATLRENTRDMAASLLACGIDPDRSILFKQSSAAKFEKRIFSGIQPTGIPHIGNYFGAIKQWVELQEAQNLVILSIVDLHAITVPQDPATLRENTRDMAASLLACGIDPDRSILFKQSSVSEHAELAWILSCLTTVPRLQHLPQWKHKSASLEEVPLGLFTYPVLQAADILLYKSTGVPVGEDQVQHIELCRHLAKLFNKKYGRLFPQPTVLTGDCHRLKSLRDPTVKMSKSDADFRSRLELCDTDDVIRTKLRKAVSDFTPAITYEPDCRPAIANLLHIHAALTGSSPAELCDECAHLDTLGYKTALAEVIAERLSPIRAEIMRLRADPEYMDGVLASGSERAAEIAKNTMAEVKQRVGLS